ncbi:MAG: type 4a pilus biogenesis protein PilO [Phycisphaeraceae bacterium]|nr:type 4a pilus biogenesis protein PilO [Phycisphaeraceae bacterium]
MSHAANGLRQAFFFAVLVAVPVASFFMVFRPQNIEIARAKKEIEHKQAMLDKLRQATAMAADLERQNAQIRESIQSIEARLPSTKEMDNVLRQLAEIADQNGLKVPNFKKSDKPLQAGMAMEQPLDVEITGDFDGFYQFLLALEQLPRITRLLNVEIARAPDVDGNMKAKCVLSIYYQRDEGQIK